MDTKKSRIIIGLYSPAPQSGKSTFAEYLSYKYRFSRYSCAEPLKEMLRCLLWHNCSEEEVNELFYNNKSLEILKERTQPILWGKTYRELCQSLGDWGRNDVSPDLWVNALMNRVAARDRVVIDDVRLPNEAQAIRDRGGFLIKIVRDSATRPNNHHSEGGLENEKFDAVLTNNGSVEEFLHQGVEALKNLNIPMHYNAH